MELVKFNRRYGPERLGQVFEVYNDRCNRAIRKKRKKHIVWEGVKKIDLFGGMVMFGGLTKKCGDQEFHLLVKGHGTSPPSTPEID
jgi:hypothetical protein